MRLTRREQLDATPQEVYAVLTDRGFQEAKCAETTDGGRHSVDITETAVGHRVHTERELPATDLPEIARSFVGETLLVVETYDWGAAAADGSREATLELHIKGAPLMVRGMLGLVVDGAGSAQVLDGELKANVPFIGGTIEKAASEPINRAIQTEIEMVRERLRG